MKMNVCSNGVRPNKSNFPQTIRVCLLATLLASCAPPKTETIVVRGSNTIGEELAPRLIAEFKMDHPAVAFDLEFKGTTYGMGGLMVGRCDIGAASRPASTNELDLAKDRGIKFGDYVIGSYSVAVIAHGASPVGSLTTDQVRDIFTGAIQNWKDVGGPDAPIHLYIRDPISGTYLGFQELAMEKKPYAAGLKTFTNYAAIVQAVSRDANGIGYSSVELAAKPGVKAVAVGGVLPTLAAVKEGKYPYTRVLRFYTDKSRETPSVTGFIQFVQSTRGQQIMDEMGYVPKP